MVCEALLATSHLPSCMHARTAIKQSMLIARHTIISAYTLLFVLILPCSVGCGSSLVRPDTTKRHRHDTAYPSRRRSSSPTTPCHENTSRLAGIVALFSTRWSRVCSPTGYRHHITAGLCFGRLRVPVVHQSALSIALPVMTCSIAASLGHARSRLLRLPSHC
jgi:hypothetical protein